MLGSFLSSHGQLFSLSARSVLTLSVRSVLFSLRALSSSYLRALCAFLSSRGQLFSLSACSVLTLSARSALFSLRALSTSSLHAPYSFLFSRAQFFLSPSALLFSLFARSVLTLSARSVLFSLPARSVLFSLCALSSSLFQRTQFFFLFAHSVLLSFLALSSFLFPGTNSVFPPSAHSVLSSLRVLSSHLFPVLSSLRKFRSLISARVGLVLPSRPALISFFSLRYQFFVFLSFFLLPTILFTLLVLLFVRAFSYVSLPCVQFFALFLPVQFVSFYALSILHSACAWFFPLLPRSFRFSRYGFVLSSVQGFMYQVGIDSVDVGIKSLRIRKYSFDEELIILQSFLDILALAKFTRRQLLSLGPIFREP